MVKNSKKMLSDFERAVIEEDIASLPLAIESLHKGWLLRLPEAVLQDLASLDGERSLGWAKRFQKLDQEGKSIPSAMFESWLSTRSRFIEREKKLRDVPKAIPFKCNLTKIPS